LTWPMRKSRTRERLLVREQRDPNPVEGVSGEQGAGALPALRLANPSRTRGVAPQEE
jgi:hypothetical protein